MIEKSERRVRSSSRCPLLIAHELSPLGLRERKSSGSRFFLFAPFSFFEESCGMWITRAEISCGPLQRILQEFTLRVVPAEEMRAEGDAESQVQMLMDEDAAFGKRDAQMRRLDLKDSALKGDGVVVADGAFRLD